MDALPRSLRWVLLAWVIVGVAVSVRTVLKPNNHTVFPVFATGSLNWWGDIPVYDDHAPLDFFRYPPFFAVAVTPLALAGTTVGGVLWSWLSLGVYGWGCWRFLRDVIPRRWSVDREAVFLALALFAAGRGIWNSQSNALVCGLLLLGCAEAVRERWWRSAIWLSLAVLIKLTPLAVVLLLIVVRPRQLGPRVAVVLLLGGLIPFFTRPIAVVVDQHAGWVAQMRETAKNRWPGFRDAWLVWNLATNPPTGDLKEYLTVTMRSDQAAAYRAVQLVTAGLAFLWVLWLRGQGLPERLIYTLALGVGTGWLLLVGPSVEHPTFVLLAPTLLWGLLEEKRSWLIGLASFVILVLGWGALTDPFAARYPWLLVPLPIGTTLYLFWLLWSGPTVSGILPPRRDTAIQEITT